MSTITVSEVKNEAMLLSIKERAWLIRELLESLDPIKGPEIENAWIIEAEKRYSRYSAGQAKTRSAADVFANIQTPLQ